MRKTKIILLSTVLLANVNPLISADSIENERENNSFIFNKRDINDEVQKTVRSYGNVSNFIWHAVTAGGSRCDYQTPTLWSLDMMKNHFRLLALELFNSGKFKEAFSLPATLTRFLDNEGRDLANAYTWADPIKHIRSIVPQLEQYIRYQAPSRLGYLMNSSRFLESINLAEEYYSIPDNLRISIEGSNTWRDEIWNRATSQVQGLGRKSKFLEQLDPGLAEQEVVQARRLIESFPAGHALRGHLQQQFEAARASVVFPAEPELALLEVQRRLADRLIDQNR